MCDRNDRFFSSKLKNRGFEDVWKNEKLIKKLDEMNKNAHFIEFFIYIMTYYFTSKEVYPLMTLPSGVRPSTFTMYVPHMSEVRHSSSVS